MTNQDKMNKEREILQKNLSFSLTKKRLGRLENKHDPALNLDGLSEMATRLNLHGGYFQQNREIKDKQRSLERALLYAYQGAFVKKYYPKDDKIHKAEEKRVLINPNKVKQDYDEKMISAPFDYEYAAGDIVEWVGTNTYWLIYNQELTELAYFRGCIRRCSYKITWKDGETYVAVQGPSENGIETGIKHDISIDSPNYSLKLLVPKSEKTVNYFKRYTKFFLSNTLDEEKVCWRVEAVDNITTPGIIEVVAKEYYYNNDVDDVENGIIEGLVKEKENPNEDLVEETIEGSTFIKPRTSNQYHYTGTAQQDWKIKGGKDLPIKTKLIDDYTIEILWDSSYSGQFTIEYNDFKKTVVVESLF